jgi:hypothetical protein
MSQSHAASLGESAANVVLGFGLSFAILWLAYPESFGTNTAVSAVMIPVSFFRGYCVRRAFEYFT